jgi:hypothetical protein
MAIITHQCPHCMTEHIALRVRLGVDFGNWKASAHLDCPKCLMPSCAILLAASGSPLNPDSWARYEGDLSSHRWEITEFWPEVAGPLMPEDLPADVERIYLAAERNFPTPGNEEPAGAMYRKALDVGLKKIDPETKGVLATRIMKLATAGKLTPDIAEWSGHIRVLGNEASHDEEPPTREELTDLRNFTEMVMRYLFSLPAMVNARKPPPD